MKRLVKAIGLASTAMLAMPTTAFAFRIDRPAEWVKYTDIGLLIGNAIGLILIIAALIFFLMLVAGGVQWMMSGGDKAATEAARGRITAALVGLIIVFAAWAIMKLIETFLGITIISGEVIIPGPESSPRLPAI